MQYNSRFSMNLTQIDLFMLTPFLCIPTFVRRAPLYAHY